LNGEDTDAKRLPQRVRRIGEGQDPAEPASRGSIPAESGRE
jgi:hypothetical protein